MLKKTTLFLFAFLFFVNSAMAESIFEVTTKYSALRGEWDKVVEGAQDWLKEEPDNASAHLLLSLGYHFTKEYPKSYFEYKILMKNKESQNKNIKWAENLVRENPRNHLGYFILSYAYSCMSYSDVNTDMSRERRAKAIEALKKAIEINPKFAIAYSDLAMNIATDTSDIKDKLKSSPSQDLQKKYDDMIKEAMGYADRAVSLEPDNLDTFSGLATVYIIKEDYEPAILNTKKALEIAPIPTSYMLLGAIYLSKKSYDEAIESLNKAIELDPQEAFFYATLSMAYYGKGMYGEAIKIANKAITMDADKTSILAYLALGMSYHKLGQINESKIYFRKVTEIDPTGNLGSLAEFFLMMIEKGGKAIE